jgi:hypothetical protein
VAGIRNPSQFLPPSLVIAMEELASTPDANALVPDDRADTQRSAERLMGTKAEGRFDFIQERAEFASTEMLGDGGAVA